MTQANRNEVTRKFETEESVEEKVSSRGMAEKFDGGGESFDSTTEFFFEIRPSFLILIPGPHVPSGLPLRQLWHGFSL